MKYITNDILEITWMDVYSAIGWTDEEQLQYLIKNENLLRMHTIGYFIYEDSLCLFLAQTRDEKEEPSRGNVVLIPKKSILKIEKINKELKAKNNKELLKKKVIKNLGNRKLTKEEADGLKEAGNEDLIQYSRSLLRESKG